MSSVVLKMGVWYVVLLFVISSVVANVHDPVNPPYLIEEVKATAESRVLERVEKLLQALSDKINVLDDGIDDMKRDINSLHLARNESIKSFENVTKQLQNLSTRNMNMEQKLEPLPQIIGVQIEMQEMIKTTSKSFSQRMVNVEQKLEPLPQIIRVQNEMQEMIKTTNESFSQRLINLQHSVQRLLGDSGVYLMQPDPSDDSERFNVFRDCTNNHGFGSNWIVFQRRINGSVDFYRNWTEYKDGFGNLYGEHWLGLEKLNAIVKTRRHELLIVLEDFDGVIAYAHYDDFQIGDESDQYVLKSVGKYSGTAGDSFTYHEGVKFSTYDQNNDYIDINYSEIYKGAWWFDDFLFSHLNGPYLKGTTEEIDEGVNWLTFRGLYYSLKSSKMMVRPVA